MPSISYVVFKLLLGLCSLLCICQALELQEIRPRTSHSTRYGRSLAKRDFSVIELKSTETFLWGAEDGSEATLGEFTVDFSGQNENVLSLEKFDGLLTKVQCSQAGLTLTFGDDAAFAYAQRVWDWVNGADNHTFLIVVGKGDCGDNPRRLPYLVSSLAYDEESNIAKLQATTGDWKDLVHSYELRVGNVPMNSDAGLTRRDYTKSASIPLGTDFGGKANMEIERIVAELECDPCQISGSIELEFIIKTKFKIPVGFQFRAAPKGVRVEAVVGVSVTSNFDTKAEKPRLGKEWSLGKYPLAGISIPGGILTVGPVIDFQWGWEATAVELGFQFKTGATAAFSDNARLQADLLSPSKNEFSGWSPTFKPVPLTASGKLSSYVQVFINPALQLEAEALGQGFGTGLDFKVPYFELRAEGVASTNGGGCKDGDTKDLAIKIKKSFGFEIKFTAGKLGKTDKDVDINIGTASFPIGDDLCVGYDDPNNNPKGLPAPSEKATLPVPSEGPGGKAPNSCTAEGKAGTCVTTDSCANKGGESTAGLCPKDPTNVQCCTSKTGGASSGSANTCEVSGTAGSCVSVGSCKSTGGTSTPGHCPKDPTDIQCCTIAPKTTSHPVSESCKVGTVSGTCVSTSSCKSSGKTSTPGHCPNDPADVQCCTAKAAAIDDDDHPATKKAPNTCKLGDGGASGTCISTTSCKASGKISTQGFCPNDPDNVRCCTEPENCKLPNSATSGDCIATTDCASSGGNSTPGLCNGAVNIQCCTKETTTARPMGGPRPERRRG